MPFDVVARLLFDYSRNPYNSDADGYPLDKLLHREGRGPLHKDMHLARALAKGYCPHLGNRLSI
jgi:hypothetical protein